MFIYTFNAKERYHRDNKMIEVIIIMVGHSKATRNVVINCVVNILLSHIFLRETRHVRGKVCQRTKV